MLLAWSQENVDRKSFFFKMKSTCLIIGRMVIMAVGYHKTMILRDRNNAAADVDDDDLYIYI